LIEDHPWFGVGYKNVRQEAPRYRGKGSDEFPDWMYQHMHNNFLQIAAERGIPGLLIWMWFMLRLAWDALRVYRARPGGSRESLIISTAALGAWVAFLIAGLLEYNFGDSEVLTLFLFIMSAPYVFRQFQIPNSKFRT
jgi:O-antigen ligase